MEGPRHFHGGSPGSCRLLLCRLSAPFQPLGGCSRRPPLCGFLVSQYKTPSQLTAMQTLGVDFSTFFCTKVNSAWQLLFPQLSEALTQPLNDLQESSPVCRARAGTHLPRTGSLAS